MAKSDFSCVETRFLFGSHHFASVLIGVAEVRSNVATFFMSQYTNFIQFGGESDGATRCTQVTQLLAAAWAQHSDENPLVVIQLDIVNATPLQIGRLNSMC